MGHETALLGLRVLVVEDEPLIAMAIEDVLTDAGCAVVGPAASLKQGLRLFEQETIDGAVLDINLSGEMVFPLADALAEHAIPFVYLTGYGEVKRTCDTGRPVLQKPCDNQQLLKIARKWQPRLQQAAAVSAIALPRAAQR